MENSNQELSRYEKIALLLAKDIAAGIYKEGEKISGRSTLAGKYNISPETVRKALMLLHYRDVVDVVPSSGTRVLSRQAAQNFIDSFAEQITLVSLEKRLSELTRQRNKLNTEIERVIKEIVAYKTHLLKNMQKAEEVKILPGSPLVGKSLFESRLRTVTGVTVSALRHRGRWYVSPGIEMQLSAGDILLAMGPPGAIARLRKLASVQVEKYGQEE